MATFGDVPMSLKAVPEWIVVLSSGSSAELAQLISSKAAHCKEDLRQCMFSSSADSVARHWLKAYLSNDASLVGFPFVRKEGWSN